MTKYERLAISISSLALIVSLSVPILNYFFFNPIKAQQRYAGRLEVSERFTYSGGQKTGYDMDLKNVGEGVLTNIEIGAMTIDPGISIPTRKDQIQTIPIRDFDFKSEGNRLFIRFPGFLENGQTIRVILDGLYFPQGSRSNAFRVDVACSSGEGKSTSVTRGAGADD